MKKLLHISFLLLLAACSGITPPPKYVYQEINTRNFDIVTWQKITNPQATYKFYIEGDGYAFNSYGRPTQDPTPKTTLVRKLAFADPSPNVIYLARPCQYVQSKICSQRHWTSARFAPEVVNAEYEAIKQIAGRHRVVLIGFSGGAQIAGLVSSAKPGLNVQEIITIAGNLDHLSWTRLHNLPQLNESLNLADYKELFMKIPQKHFVGEQDLVIPPSLIQNFVGDKAKVEVIKGASHNAGWKPITAQIYSIQ